MILDHQFFPVPFEEKTDFCCGGRVLDQENVLQDLVKIKKIYGFQRPPDFFPTATKFRSIQNIHQRPFKACDPQIHACTFLCPDIEHFFPPVHKGFRETGPLERMSLERKNIYRSRSRICKNVAGRVGTSEKTQCGEVRNDRIGCQFGCQQIWIHRKGFGGGAGRDSCI